jgi:hypothetical protein
VLEEGKGAVPKVDVFGSKVFESLENERERLGERLIFGREG